MSSVLERAFRAVDRWVQRKLTPDDQKGQLERGFVDEDLERLDGSSEPSQDRPDQPAPMYFGSGLDPADTLAGLSQAYLEQLRRESDKKS